MDKIRIKIHTIVVIFFSLILSTPGYADDQDIIDAGDTLQWALPVSAYIGTWIAGDKEGAILYTKSLATTVVMTSVIKDTASKFRPQGESTKSFPSGHTSAAFSGAAFIDTRYGHGFGIPAYALAAFTGYSRVIADAHHVDDVVAGASVALFSNWFWVRPAGRFGVTPVAVDGGAAVVLSVNDGKEKKDYSGELGYPRYRYALDFGPAALRENKVISPTATGTEFNLYDFQRRNDPTTTANAVFEMIFTPKHTLGLHLLPFEARDIGEFSSAVNFAGSTFPANSEIYSSYRLTDFRARYDYTVFNVADWKMTAGATLAYQRTVVELRTSDGTVSGKVSDEALLPLANANLSYNFTRKFKVYADAAATSISDYEILHGSLGVGYQLDKHWDLAFGLGVYDRTIETAELSNKLRYDISYFTLGYTF